MQDQTITFVNKFVLVFHGKYDNTCSQLLPRLGCKNIEIEKSKKVLDILRWVDFLPVAVLATCLALIAINILGRFSLDWVGITPEDFQGKLIISWNNSVGHGAMGAAFVYVGAKIAPTYQVIVAFILGGIGIFSSGSLLFYAVMFRDWWAVWEGICVAIGAGAVVWSVHAGETDIV